MANFTRWLEENYNGRNVEEKKLNEDRQPLNELPTEVVHTATECGALLNGISSEMTEDISTVNIDGPFLNGSMADDVHDVERDSPSGEKSEAVYTAEGQTNDIVYSASSSVTTMITDEELMNTIFQTCDVKKSGQVHVSGLMDYINGIIAIEENHFGELANLWRMFDVGGDDVQVDLNTYQRVMKQWIQRIRANNYQQESINSVPLISRADCGDLMVVSPNRSLIAGCSSSAKLNSSSIGSSVGGDASLAFDDYGSIEGLTGNQSALDAVELLNENNQLRHQIQTVIDQKFRSDRLVSASEEQLLQVVAERDDLRKRVSSLQSVVEKNRSLMKDCADLRESLACFEDDNVSIKQQVVELEKEKLAQESRIEFLEEELTSTCNRLEQVTSVLEDTVKLASQQKDELEHRSELLLVTEAKMGDQVKQIKELEECLTECKVASQNLREEKHELERQLTSREEADLASKSHRAIGERRLFLKSGSKSRSFSGPPSPDRSSSWIDDLSPDGQSSKMLLLEHAKVRVMSKPSHATPHTALPMSVHAELKHMILNFPSPLCEKSFSSENGVSGDGLVETVQVKATPKGYVTRGRASSIGHRFQRTRRYKSSECFDKDDFENSDNQRGRTSSSNRKCNRLLCAQTKSRLKKHEERARSMLMSTITALTNIRRQSEVLCRMCESLLASTHPKDVPDVSTSFPDDVLRSDGMPLLTTKDLETVTDVTLPTSPQESNERTQLFDSFYYGKKQVLVNNSPDFVKEYLAKEMDALKRQITRSQEILNILTRTSAAAKSVSSDEPIESVAGAEARLSSPGHVRESSSQATVTTRSTQTVTPVEFQPAHPVLPRSQPLDGVSFQMSLLRRNSFLTAVTRGNQALNDDCRRSSNAANRRKRKLSVLPEEAELDNSPLVRRDNGLTAHRPLPSYRDSPRVDSITTIRTPNARFVSHPCNQHQVNIPTSSSCETARFGVGTGLEVGNIDGSPLTTANATPRTSRMSIVTTQNTKAARRDSAEANDSQTRRGSLKKRLAFSGIRRSSAIEEDDMEDSSRPPRMPLMPEHESSETESAKGSMELEPEPSAGAGVPISTTDDHGPSPNLPDHLLIKLNVQRDSKDNSYEGVSEQEIERKFNCLELAIRADKVTVGRRLERHHRQRDLAETNVEMELQFLNDSLNEARQFCPDSLALARLTEIQRRINVLRQASERVSSRAEIYGAVQQEERVIGAVEVMVMHVENVVRQSGVLRNQLEDLGRLLTENHLLEDGRLTRSAETTPKAPTSALGFSSFLDGGQVQQRRRASVALITNQSRATSTSCPATPCREFHTGAGRSPILRGNSVDGYFSYQRPRLSGGTALQLTTIAQQNGSVCNLANKEGDEETTAKEKQTPTNYPETCTDAGGDMVTSGGGDEESDNDQGTAATTADIVQKADQKELQMAVRVKRWLLRNRRQHSLQELGVSVKERESPCIHFLRNFFCGLLLLFAVCSLLAPHIERVMMSSWIPSSSDGNSARFQDRPEQSGPETRHASNDNWTSVQSAVVGLFQKKKLSEKQLFSLKQNVRNLHDLNGGYFMFDFHVKQVLTRGAVILREKIRAFRGLDLLNALAETWDYFYGEIVPTLQAIFFPVKPKYASIRHASFLAFRDVVVLKVATKEALDDINNLSNVIPAGIPQMLLILLNVRDTDYPNEKRLALEKLVAKVVVPYLDVVGVAASKMAKRKTMTETRRLSRPMSVQNFRLHATVEDMYRSAYSKSMRE